MIKQHCFTDEWLEKFKKQKDLELILQNVIESSNFTGFELDEHCSYQPGVPKAHYKFKFDSNRRGSGTILLDVLIEDSIYPEVIEKSVNAKWIETEDETTVNMPSIDGMAFIR